VVSPTVGDIFNITKALAFVNPSCYNFFMKYIYAALLGLVIGAAVTWYARPEKVVVKIEEKEVVREVVKLVEKKAANVVTKRVVETKPDGSTTTSEVIEDRSVIDFTLTAENEKVKEHSFEKRTRTSSYNWRITGGVGLNPLGNYGQPHYLLGLERRILGPLSAGVTAVSNREHHLFFLTASWTF
jgi:hypothetical protein